MRPFDLAIVGAGFAGLTCATAAAARGLRTVVLERKAHPGDSCHTTGILVKEVADAWDVPISLTRRIHGVRLYSPSLRYVDLASAGYFFLATDTPRVMAWLTDIAVGAGAEILCRTSYRGATVKDNRVQLAEGDVNCRYLIGADGPQSRVAGDFNLGRNRSFLTGAEVEMTGVRGLPDDLLHVFLDARLAPGTAQAM